MGRKVTSMKNRIALSLGLTALAFWIGAPAGAQDANKTGAVKKERASPHEEVSASIGGKKVTISYGRPFKKNRVIFGGLEPWGKVWRTGADEATTLTTEADLMMGPLHVVAGTYSLFTIPNEKEWTFILNKTAKQWGAFKYDQAMDYGRTAMTVSIAKAPVEQMSIAIDKKNDHEGVIKVMWDQTVASVEFMVH
jgi:hypothetical protein